MLGILADCFATATFLARPNRPAQDTRRAGGGWLARWTYGPHADAPRDGASIERRS